MHRTFAGRSIASLWGQRRDLNVAAPAKGKEWSYLLPGGYFYRVLLGYTLLKTEAGAGNRFPSFVIKDGDGLERFISTDPGASIAAQEVNVSYGIDFTTQQGTSKQIVTIGLPDVLIVGGWTIGSFTPGLLAGDEYLNIRLTIEELMDPYPGIAAGLQGRQHLDPLPELVNHAS